jgi:hypothetical protein
MDLPLRLRHESGSRRAEFRTSRNIVECRSGWARGAEANILDSLIGSARSFGVEQDPLRSITPGMSRWQEPWPFAHGRGILRSDSCASRRVKAQAAYRDSSACQMSIWLDGEVHIVRALADIPCHPEVVPSYRRIPCSSRQHRQYIHGCASTAHSFVAGTYLGVSNSPQLPPRSLVLAWRAPNPVRVSAEIRFELPNPPVSICGHQGQAVATLLDHVALSAGRDRTLLETRSLAS